MIIENKNLEASAPATSAFAQGRQPRQRQAQDLIRKLNIGDVSFMSTDLDQTTQFDFNNKINK